MRLAGGCSASFVSPDGLVMTNHHCAHALHRAALDRQQDFVEGRLLRQDPGRRGEAAREMEINQLVEITDVTDRVAGRDQGPRRQGVHRRRRRPRSRSIEKACQTSERASAATWSPCTTAASTTSTSTSAYQDVRLVFAPEFAIAFFGGDPDNFNFPRYDLDVSLPARLRGRQAGCRRRTTSSGRRRAPSEGELTFVSGNPGRTSRLLTVAQLASQRDEILPLQLAALAQLRGWLDAVRQRSAEARRISQDDAVRRGELVQGAVRPA